jgi:N-acetylmuramoyl-L-alanine amidase
MIRPILAAALALSTTPPVLTVASTRGERSVDVVSERGFPAVAAVPLADVLSLELPASPPGTATVRVLGQPFEFVLEAGYFRFDDRIYTLAAGPYVARDTLFLPLQWIAEYLPRLLGARYRYDPDRARLEELPPPVAIVGAGRADAPTRPSAASRRRRLIAVDPGHGGIDDGMSGPLGRSRFLHEKDVTLAVSRALVDELARRGYGTLLTRNRDTLVALGDRGRIAGSAGADLFVSIHVNAANPGWRDASTHRGFETYFLAEARTEDARRLAQMENSSVRFETTARAQRGDPLSYILQDLAQNEHLRESSRLAELVQSSLGAVHPAENRGVKQAGFMVLATSYMPAVLVELGFGSNDAEARYLTSSAGQRALARAIADGVERYLTEYERRVGS